MLTTDIKNQLKTYLERLQRPITLVATLDTSESSQQLEQLLQDIAQCSPLVTIRLDGNASRVPSFTVGASAEAARVTFAGLPLGHEFTSLVLALLLAGGHPSKESAGTLEQIRTLVSAATDDNPLRLQFEAYISLSCHNCPDVVQALNLMAVLNPAISVSTVDGALFQKEVEERGVLAVPAVFLNGKPFASGRMTLEEVLAKLGAESTARDANKLSSKEAFDVLVVGAGPAGAAAAVYAARKGIRTGLVADRLGGQVNDTLAIENYISVLETQGPRFASDLEAHVRHYGVDVMRSQRVAKVVSLPGTKGLVEVHTETGGVLKTRSLVLAPGARWRSLAVPGEQEYKNRGVAYCPHCDGPLFKGKRVAVVGGGNSGVEAALDLAGIASHVTLIEFGDKLRADAVLVTKLQSMPNVSVVTQAQTTEIYGDGTRVTALGYRDRVSDSLHRVDLEGVFVQIGLVPNTDFLRDTLELNQSGEIVVNAKGQTSLPGVFAAGDATTTPYKQIVIAAGDGAKAALSAFDHLVRTS